MVSLNFHVIPVFLIGALLANYSDSKDTTKSSPSGLPSYSHAIQKVENLRLDLTRDYQEAASEPERAKILNEGRALMTTCVGTTLLPHWYGTPWDYNGSTQIPGEGQIACGYLVSTVLRDAGLKVQRVRLAQQISEWIIQSLTSERHIRRYSKTPVEEFVESIRDWGEGLYIVGLDQHVGFIVHDADGVWFVHSSYMNPKVVLKECALKSRILASSGYRVLGKLSADDDLIIKWLEGRTIPTKAIQGHNTNFPLEDAGDHSRG